MVHHTRVHRRTRCRVATADRNDTGRIAPWLNLHSDPSAASSSPNHSCPVGRRRYRRLQGAKLTVAGQGNDLKVNDAGVVCGGVHTANATVYMIDTVLMPPGR
ncbi:fasciclin domain-containing protein [Mycobacterium seoulense]|uniref:fasciclin domain-containing protein n=1 Tax=Mycobacterium seoulense TaxID=386911 RepID=UPI003CF458EA